MKILIIGSNGFIGKNIASYFANKNNDVFCCDILKFAAKNYKQLDENHPDYNEVFYQKKYDLCINCSGSANVFTSFTETFNDFKLNVSNLAKMLNALKEYNPECKFINISSAAVYGNPSKIPIFEKSELLPVSPYGFHKLISEIILDEYYRIWNIKTCSLRIFSAYGN
jgi:dTDP-glucose 4,6-dehydratase/UDP-glucose 4-epimerase